MLGHRLKELRDKQKITQKDVANHLNISRQAYGFYENEKRSPDYETLQKVATYFGVSISYLLDDENINLTINEEPEKYNTTQFHKIDGYDDLDEEGQKKVLEYIELLKQKHTKK